MRTMQNYVGPVTVNMPGGETVNMNASLQAQGTKDMTGNLSGKNVPPGLLHGTAPLEGAQVVLTFTQNFPPVKRKFVIGAITSAQNVCFLHVTSAGDWLP